MKYFASLDRSVLLSLCWLRIFFGEKRQERTALCGLQRPGLWWNGKTACMHRALVFLGHGNEPQSHQSVVNERSIRRRHFKTVTNFSKPNIYQLCCGEKATLTSEDICQLCGREKTTIISEDSWYLCCREKTTFKSEDICQLCCREKTTFKSEDICQLCCREKATLTSEDICQLCCREKATLTSEDICRLCCRERAMLT